MIRTTILAVVAFVAITSAQNIEVISINPSSADEIYAANANHVAVVVSEAGKMGDVLEDYVVLSRINMFIAAPNASDPNFDQVCKMVNLAKAGKMSELRKYIGDLTVSSQIGNPNFVQTARTPAPVLSQEQQIRVSYMKACPKASKKDADRYVRETLETFQKWNVSQTAMAQ